MAAHNNHVTGPATKASLLARKNPNHPRKCQANLVKRQKVCGNFALKGSKYCKFHGGRMARTSSNGVSKQKKTKLPAVYGKFLTKTLHDALEDQLGIKPSEQLQVLEELALLRDFAGQTVALYAAARDSGKSNAVMATGAMMSEMLQKVARMSETAAKISSATSDQYSIHDLQYIVLQLVHILYRTCGPVNEHIAVEFERRIATELVLPKSPEGVTYQPHEDVSDMDATIPEASSNGVNGVNDVGSSRNGGT